MFYLIFTVLMLIAVLRAALKIWYNAMFSAHWESVKNVTSGKYMFPLKKTDTELRSEKLKEVVQFY